MAYKGFFMMQHINAATIKSVIKSQADCYDQYIKNLGLENGKKKLWVEKFLLFFRNSLPGYIYI
jgi:hypothetical protein